MRQIKHNKDNNQKKFRVKKKESKVTNEKKRKIVGGLWLGITILWFLMFMTMGNDLVIQWQNHLVERDIEKIYQEYCATGGLINEAEQNPNFIFYAIGIINEDGDDQVVKYGDPSIQSQRHEEHIYVISESDWENSSNPNGPTRFWMAGSMATTRPEMVEYTTAVYLNTEADGDVLENNKGEQTMQTLAGATMETTMAPTREEEVEEGTTEEIVEENSGVWERETIEETHITWEVETGIEGSFFQETQSVINLDTLNQEELREYFNQYRDSENEMDVSNKVLAIYGGVSSTLKAIDCYWWAMILARILSSIKHYLLPCLFLVLSILYGYTWKKQIPVLRDWLKIWGVVASVALVMIWCSVDGTVLLIGILAALCLVTMGCFIWQQRSLSKILVGTQQMVSGDLQTPIVIRDKDGLEHELAESINHVAEGMNLALEDKMKSERMKTELITNVSHDLKTPLTMIVSTADLLKKTNVEDEQVREYIELLNHQSRRLHKLVLDLIEASKASSGNLNIRWENCEFDVLLDQLAGEYEDRLKQAQLSLELSGLDDKVHILADGNYLWRVFDNLMSNVCKYSQEGTRVYLDLICKDGFACATIRNISKYKLNISAEELMERFVRGDSSRSTEGSGLGLSIARDMTELMNGQFSLSIDGDLFKVTIKFPLNDNAVFFPNFMDVSERHLH
ncbi:MAG: histidine kinase dimerization/phospho-acceptor domain-containing protein [Lachnospiraceae bacterium]